MAEIVGVLTLRVGMEEKVKRTISIMHDVSPCRWGAERQPRETRAAAPSSAVANAEEGGHQEEKRSPWQPNNIIYLFGIM